MGLETIIGVAGAAREWINAVRGWRLGGRDRHNAALRALYTAANETQIYISRQSRRIANGPAPARDFDREEKLSRLWVEASILIREFDHDLAERCHRKGGYWTDPDAWTAQEIRAARIELKRVVDEARELLWA